MTRSTPLLLACLGLAACVGSTGPGSHGDDIGSSTLTDAELQAEVERMVDA